LGDNSLQPDPGLVLARLARVFGFPRHGNPKDAFFCAVYVLLSAQTTLEQAAVALKALRRKWPSPLRLSRARASAVLKVIRSCGFGSTRTEKILALARAVATHPVGLRALNRYSNDDLEAALVALPGIGFKSARVIASMSSYERDRFGIDTHIWRIAQRLGWIPHRRTDRKPTELQASSLEMRIPVADRRQLHACLVALGRTWCRPLRPRCSTCVLNDLCANAISLAAQKPEHA
jgi:endonuclease-3